MEVINIMEGICKIYDAIDEKLKFLSTSGIRIKILTSLLEAPKTSTQLKDEIGGSTSTIIHAARDLEKEKFIVEESDGYHLTSIGRIMALKLSEIIKTAYTVHKSEDFWINHAVDEIPNGILREVYMLWNHKVITSSTRNIFRTLTAYLKIVRRAKVFYGVSPVFVDAFVSLVKNLLKRGAKVNIVLTEDVFEEIKKINVEELKELIKNKSLEIWLLNERPPFAFTVTDSALSLGLFRKDGIYDPTQDLISFDNEARKWGIKVFEYYRNKAKRVLPEDLE